MAGLDLEKDNLDTLTDEQLDGEIEKFLTLDTEEEAPQQEDKAEPNSSEGSFIEKEIDKLDQEYLAERDGKKENSPEETPPQKEDKGLDKSIVIDDSFIAKNPDYAKMLEKFKGKDLSELVKSYHNLEKKLGERQKADQLDQIERKPAQVEPQQPRELPKLDESFKDKMVLNALKSKHSDLLEEYPNAFNSLKDFERALTDLNIESRLKADEVIDTYRGVKKSVDDDFRYITNIRESHEEINGQAVNDVVGEINSYLQKRGLSDKDLGVSLAVGENGENAFIEGLLFKDGRPDPAIMDSNIYNVTGVNIINKERLIDKFRRSYDDLVWEKVQGKARDEGFKSGTSRTRVPSLSQADTRGHIEKEFDLDELVSRASSMTEDDLDKQIEKLKDTL